MKNMLLISSHSLTHRQDMDTYYCNKFFKPSATSWQMLANGNDSSSYGLLYN